MEKKTHFREVERYWVNKPHSFVVIFHSGKRTRRSTTIVEPVHPKFEIDLRGLSVTRTAIKYSEDDVIVQGTDAAGHGQPAGGRTVLCG